MTHYFMNLHTRDHAYADPEGIHLIDLSAARDNAIMAARDIMFSEMTEGLLCFSCFIEICDAAGTVMMVVPFQDAVSISGLQLMQAL